MSAKKTSWLWILVALAGLFVFWRGGCGPQPFSAEDTVARSFTTGEAPSVVVETFNGRIDVIALGEGTVEAQVTRRASGLTPDAADEALENIDVEMGQEGDRVVVRARLLDRGLFNRGGGAAVTVQVPRRTALELRTSNGPVAVTGETGDVTADSSNGRVEVKGGRGRLRLSTSNGGIDVASEEALLELHTSNGGITFTGALAAGPHTCRTSNGPVRLKLPAASNFGFEARTSNGRVSCDFPVTRTGGKGDKRLEGTVGEVSSVFLSLRTSNGSIRIDQDR